MFAAEAAARPASRPAAAKPCSSSCRHVHFLEILAAAAILLPVAVIAAGQTVEYLPGYDGRLPFHLQTGYISVGDSELFYYFIESQGDPLEDPLILWLTGGPGCSSFNGLAYETGPLEFVIENYTGGLPQLRHYPYAWTKTANMIFLDQPVGAGFSYSRTLEGWPSSDSKSAQQSYEFLLKWLEENTKYLEVQLYVAGDSYSGMMVPLITKLIADGNKNGHTPYMNLKGMMLGSPRTDSIIDENSKVVFSHRMALISDEIYENAKRACNESYSNADPTNTACTIAIAQITKCVKGLFRYNILEPKCQLTGRISLEVEDERSLLFSPLLIPSLWCRSFNYSLSYAWANDEAVQEALHVRKGTVMHWMRCNSSLSYTHNILSVLPVHQQLKKLALQVLVFVGDRDIVIPYVGTAKWIKFLKLTISNDWRPWFLDGQIVGYTEEWHDNGYYLTYATVKGAGHTAPEYNRRGCYHMFQRWIHFYPL